MTINRENTPADWLPHARTAVEAFNKQFPDLTWGTYGGHQPAKNLATDGMVPGYKTAAGKARGWEAAKWLWANRAKYDVHYIIFDAKIISTTPGRSNWNTYVPSASAVRASRDSAYHYNHVHVSFHSKAAAVAKPKYLSTRWVDPKKVDSTLTANAPEGKEDKFREPGFAITTGVSVDGKWLVTEAGYRYHTDYLTTTKPAVEAPKPEPKPEPKTVRRRFLNSNMMRDDDTRSRFSSRDDGLAAFYVASKASVFTWQEVDPHISKDSPLMTVVSKMGSKYKYDRGGPNAVGWDATVWDADLTKAYTKKLPHIDGYGQRYLHVVPLTDKETRKKVWVASVHLNHKTGGEANGLRGRQAREVAGYLKKHIAAGEDVFLGGDFNDAGTTSGEPKGIFKAAGLKLLSDQTGVKNRKVESHHGLSGGKPTNDGRWIDDACWSGMKFVSGSLLDTWSKKLSDHNALLVELEI